MKRSPLYRRRSMPSMPSPKRRSTTAVAQGSIERDVSDVVLPAANTNLGRSAPHALPAKQRESIQDTSKGPLKSQPIPSRPATASLDDRRQPQPFSPKPPSTLPTSEPRKSLSHVATHSPAAKAQPDRSVARQTANRLNANRRKWDSSADTSTNCTISVEIPLPARTQPNSSSAPDDASASGASTPSSEDGHQFTTPLVTATTAPLGQQTQERESTTAVSDPAGRGRDYVQNPTPDTVASNTITTASLPATPPLSALLRETERDDFPAAHQWTDPAFESDEGPSCREIASRLAQEAHNHSQSLVKRVQLLAAMAESYAAKKEGLLHEVQRLEARNTDEVADFTRQIDELNKKVVQYESQIQKLQEGAVGPRTIHELKATIAKRDEELRLQNARAEALLQEVTERDTRISDLSHEVEALTKLVQERDGRIEEFKSLTGSMGLEHMVEIASRLQKWGLVSD